MRLRSPTVLALLFLLLCLFGTVPTESTQSNSVAVAEAKTNAGSKNRSRGGEEDSLADLIDRALERELSENEQNQAEDASGFNNSVAEQQAVLETVARVKSKKNDSEEKYYFYLVIGDQRVKSKKNDSEEKYYFYLVIGDQRCKLQFVEVVIGYRNT